MPQQILVPLAELERRLTRALTGAGASEASAGSAVRALMHASRLGVDSHGARLAPHYAAVLGTGRINPRPELRVTRRGAAAAVVDGDDGLGHHAAYRAMAEAVALAREAGVGAVGVVRSSHFGAAGAYALAAAEAGMVGFVTSNADSAVTLFGGRAAFHGTNPLAFAAPSGGARPWLLDMATSSVPFNRVLLYRVLGKGLPPAVAADEAGEPTEDPDAVRMLLPLGGEDFGFKGAALAGVATILAAVLQGAALDHAMLPMGGEDRATPRGMGHFCLAIDPGFFGGREAFERGMRDYLAALRALPAREGAEVMAPGDREWRLEAERARDGVPLDPETAAFLGF
jgi:ureidoglycolate dehydrogenase (NAD+)